MSLSKEINLYYTMALDFEKLGRTRKYGVCGFGASVVGPDFKQLDKLFCPMKIKGAVFQTSCYESFWKDKKDLMKQLEYLGDEKNTQDDVEREAFEQFHKFRLKWEAKAKQDGAILEVVSDNMIYDGAILNDWYGKYMPDAHPMPYTATDGEYSGHVWETDSMLRGLLIGAGVYHPSPWGLTDAVRNMFDVPKPEIEHTHLPHEDAYSIAFDHQIVLGVMNGTVKKRSTM